MKFSDVAVGRFFIHKDAGGAFHGWVKVDAGSARRVTGPAMLVRGEPVAFGAEDETVVGA